MEEKNLNEKESLELISRMIRNTQRKFEKEHAVPYLVFGYLTVLVAIVVWYLLSTTRNQQWNLLWLLIPIVGSVILYFANRNSQREVQTFVDRAVSYVWIVCGVTVFVASFVPTFYVAMPILFLVALIISMGTTLTGGITRMRLLTVSGSIGMAAAFFLLSVKGPESILFFAAIFLVTMVIPGHILYAKGRKK
ncbi:MAG TPA: hypothetical protein DDW85_08365 [Porphyromonadaceae bacterium]|jgi:hypothetical protein|nr:hypothetical protein [Porphyromonadaceae bacterium]